MLEKARYLTLTLSKAAQSENYPFCTIEPNEGMVSVPDDRLDRITTHVPTQKVIPAALKLVDIAGIVQGASEGQGLGNKFLSHIREVDAILQVVRCFDDPDVIHVAGTVDPVADMETIELELMLADLQHFETILPKAERNARSQDKEAKSRLEVLKKCQNHLIKEKPLRTLDLTDTERAAIKELGLLSAKPILYVANIDESDLEGTGELVNKVREAASAAHADVVAVCAKLEAELAELDHDDRLEMLSDVGLHEPALAVLARASYTTLGPQSFFTAGEKEVRAWTVPIGATALRLLASFTPILRRGLSEQKFIPWKILKALAAKKKFVLRENYGLKARTMSCKTATSAIFLCNR